MVLQDLSFSDTSANNSAVNGAIHLINVEDFSLVNLSCTLMGSSTAYCMLFDGGSDFTQFGVVINPSVESVRFPIQTNGNTSEINVYGGELDCTGRASVNAISGSIGIDLGAANQPSISNGEWGMFGTYWRPELGYYHHDLRHAGRHRHRREWSRDNR